MNLENVNLFGTNRVESIMVGEETIFFEIPHNEMLYAEAMEDLYWSSFGDGDKREDYYDSCLDNDSLSLHNFS